MIVRHCPPEEVTAGGIVIPQIAQDDERMRSKRARRGVVVGVGGGYRAADDVVPLDVKVGDEVLFADYIGQEITLDGVKHQHLHEESILAIIES